MSQLMAFRIAEQHVHEFDNESEVMRDHQQAMDCLDCEAFLQLGIDAFHWLIRADQTIRKATFEEKIEYDPALDNAIAQMFRDWMKPCEIASTWIAIQKKRGFSLANVDEFQRCQREVQSTIRFLDDDSMSDGMRRVCDDAVEEHNSGATTEFV